MVDPMTTHLIERIIADLDILKQSGYLQSHQVESIRSQLDPIIAPAATDDPASAQPLPCLRKPPSSTVPITEQSSDLCRAIWAYSATDADELSFAENDTIEIVERLSEGWWKGYVHNSESRIAKLLPSNYCEKIDAVRPSLPSRSNVSGSSISRTLPPVYSGPVASPLPLASSRETSYSSLGPGKWQPGKPRWTSGFSKVPSPPLQKEESPKCVPPNAPGPSGQQPASTPEEEAEKKRKLGKLGERMGQSAASGFAGGVGFGLARNLF